MFSILYYALFYFQYADLRTITACGTTQPETNTPEATVTPAQEVNTTEGVVAEDTASSQTTEETSAETPAGPQGFPATVEVCGEPVTFDAPPERVVVNDVNILELFIEF